MNLEQKHNELEAIHLNKLIRLDSSMHDLHQYLLKQCDVDFVDILPVEGFFNCDGNRKEIFMEAHFTLENHFRLNYALDEDDGSGYRSVYMFKTATIQDVLDVYEKGSFVDDKARKKLFRTFGYKYIIPLIIRMFISLIKNKALNTDRSLRELDLAVADYYNALNLLNQKEYMNGSVQRISH